MAFERLCRFSVPTLTWLGVHQDMLAEDCDPDDLQDLTKLDTRKLERLLEGGSKLPVAWRPEVQAMLDGGCKCEIEAAHKLRGMPAFVGLLVEAMTMYTAL